MNTQTITFYTLSDLIELHPEINEVEYSDALDVSFGDASYTLVMAWELMEAFVECSELGRMKPGLLSELTQTFYNQGIQPTDYIDLEN